MFNQVFRNFFIVSLILLSACGGSKDPLPVELPAASDSETDEQKAARELNENLTKKTAELETQINSALLDILQPAKIQAAVKLSELKLVDSAKEFSFENLDQLRTELKLNFEKTSPFVKIQKLIDSDFREMIAQMAYDRTTGIIGTAVTRIDTFKMAKVYSEGLFQPTKVEQLLLPIRWIDPFKTKDATSYSYDNENDQILASREIVDVATMRGSVNASSINVSVATKDVETLKEHPLFRAYGSVVIDYLKSLDPQKLKDSVQKFVEELSGPQ